MRTPSGVRFVFVVYLPCSSFMHDWSARFFWESRACPCTFSQTVFELVYGGQCPRKRGGFYFFFFNYYRSDVSVSFARGVLCPAPPLPEFPSTVFCAREFRERVKFRSLRRMVSDNSESECFGTRFLSMSIPRHCMPFFFLTLFLAAGLYPAFFFYSLGCHPSHFHSFTHSHKIVAYCIQN